MIKKTKEEFKRADIQDELNALEEKLDKWFYDDPSADKKGWFLGIGKMSKGEQRYLELCTYPYTGDSNDWKRQELEKRQGFNIRRAIQLLEELEGLLDTDMLIDTKP